ncbi:MAG: N-acetylglucosamine-6-phosphate deacetylase [Bacteroidota bacterium]
MSNLKAFIADRIFTGDDWLEDHAILTENGLIAEVIPASTLPAGIESKTFTNCFLAPSLIDLQIYGAYGKLLAVYPEADSLSRLNKYCREGGAAHCLPAVATNSQDVFYKCIDAVRDYWSQNGEGILGLHLEGPWINKEKRGAHIDSFIHSPDINEVKEILDYGKGVIKMITLAPEICSKEIIDRILSDNIIIAAGHSNATYAEATQGFQNGITTVTHLYNAMSPLQHRAPGLVGATMDHPTVSASIIPDGHHVDYAAIRIAKTILKERLFAITDAVTETSTGYYQHQPAGDKYEAGGILSGSSLNMIKALKNLVSHAGVELAEALRMCSLYPARVMRMENSIGRIRKGSALNIVAVDNSLDTATIL